MTIFPRQNAIYGEGGKNVSYKFLYLILLVLLGGCAGVISNQPLTDPRTEEPDKSLIGHWVGKDDGSPKTELHLFISESDKEAGSNSRPFMKGVLVSWGSDSTGVGEPMFSYFTVSRIGRSSYVNFYATEETESRIKGIEISWTYEDWSKQPSKYVVINRYAVQGNRLTIWRITPSKSGSINVKKLVEVGELQQDGKAFADDPKITFDSLFRYLRKNDGGAAIFDKAITFTKVP